MNSSSDFSVVMAGLSDVFSVILLYFIFPFLFLLYFIFPCFRTHYKNCKLSS